MIFIGVTPASDYEPHRLVIKQSYASKCTEKAGEHLKNFNPSVLKERSRTIKSDGTIIKFMNDHSVSVYYPNGTIYRKKIEIIMDAEHHENVEAAESTVKDKSKDKTVKKKDSKQVEEQVSQVNYIQKVKWTVVTPSGSEYLVNKEEQKYELIRTYRNVQEYDARTDEVSLFSPHFESRLL
jgi:hypothetical protein